MVNRLLKSPKLISKQICDRFKSEIAGGRYSPHTPLPSFSALAQSYGISKSTVHEAFKQLSREGFVFIKHGKGAFVNPEKIEAKKKSKLKDVAIIAFNIFSANDNYMIPLLEALNVFATLKKINIHFQFIRGMSLLSPENSLVKNAIAEGRYQGLIIASPLDIGDIQWLSSLKIPFVAATSRYNLPVPQVHHDNPHAVTLAKELFAEKRVKSIAVFTGPLSWEREHIIPYAREIYNAFKNENDLDIDFISCEYNYMDAKTKALKKCFGKKRHKGFFFQADIIAKGVLAAFKEKGADITDRVCVNYCDLEDYIAPLNIKKPLNEMGRKAFKLLERIYANEKIAEKDIVVRPEIISKT
jgi:DNA-binding LacI/PurR family transcriptional regulator